MLETKSLTCRVMDIDSPSLRADRIGAYSKGLAQGFIDVALARESSCGALNGFERACRFWYGCQNYLYEGTFGLMKENVSISGMVPKNYGLNQTGQKCKDFDILRSCILFGWK